MEYIGEISALITAVLWSMSSLAFAAASHRMGVIHLNITRLVIASVLMLITLLVLGIDFCLKPEQFFFLSTSGVIGLIIGDSFLFKAYQVLGPRITTMIMAFSPAITAAMAFFMLGESMAFAGLIGMFLTLSGIVLVLTDKKNGAALGEKNVKAGIIFAFIAAACQGIGLIFSKISNNYCEINGMMATFVRIASASIIFYLALPFFKKFRHPFKEVFANKKTFGIVTFASIVGPFLGITFSFIAIINANVGVAATLMATIPIIMLPISKFYYKEKLTWKSIAGAVLAVGGVSILFIK